MKLLICGSGIAGLFTALSLSGQGHDITLVERDGPPPEAADDTEGAERAFFDWERQGAAQFRHPHAFLGLMCSLIEAHHPELLEALIAAGARPIRFTDMLPPGLRDDYEPAPGDEKLWVMSCRRATIERVLHKHVTALPDVRLLSGRTVEGVVLEEGDGTPRVAGVKLAGGESLLAEVTLDATGRTSRFPRWFRDAGIAIAEEKDDAEIQYFTRYYRLKPGYSEPPREGGGNGDLGYLKYGVFPGDNGHFAVILCMAVAERELRQAILRPELFDDICRQVPGLDRWLDERAEATTDPAGIGDINAVWRHFVEDGAPKLLDFFAVGDAHLRTNPLYGRGCSTSLLHAHLLRDVFGADMDPVRRACAFSERTRTEIRPIFDASLADDKRAIVRAGHEIDGTPAPTGVGASVKGALRDAVSAAARENIHVMRGVMRSFNLIEPPGAFMSDWKTRAIIARYLLRGRARNQEARRRVGPDRNAMLDYVRSLTEGVSAA